MPIHKTLQKPETVSNPHEQIRRLIERLVFQANRAEKSPNPDAIHDLRVAIRRAEQAFATFKRDLPRKPVKRIRKQLKPVLSGAGELRDCDIALKILSKMRQPEAADLRGRVRVRRKEAERSLAQKLRRLSLRRRVAKWCDDLELNANRAGSNAEVLQSILTDTLPRLAQRFFTAGESSRITPEKGFTTFVFARKNSVILSYYFYPSLAPQARDGFVRSNRFTPFWARLTISGVFCRWLPSPTAARNCR